MRHDTRDINNIKDMLQETCRQETGTFSKKVMGDNFFLKYSTVLCAIFYGAYFEMSQKISLRKRRGGVVAQKLKKWGTSRWRLGWLQKRSFSCFREIFLNFRENMKH